MLFVFVAYSGEGCDYSIECGTHVFNIEADSKEKAIEEAKKHLYGDMGCGGEDRTLDDLKCYLVKEFIPINTDEWNDERRAEKEEREAEEALRQAEIELINCRARRLQAANAKKK